MSLTNDHRDILELLVVDTWSVVPMMRGIQHRPDWRREVPIKGRRVRLKELNDLGLIHVRTVTIAAWHSPVSDPPVDGYSRVEVQAILTAQGHDVAQKGKG